MTLVHKENDSVRIMTNNNTEWQESPLISCVSLTILKIGEGEEAELERQMQMKNYSSRLHNSTYHLHIVQ